MQLLTAQTVCFTTLTSFGAEKPVWNESIWTNARQHSHICTVHRANNMNRAQGAGANHAQHWLSLLGSSNLWSRRVKRFTSFIPNKVLFPVGPNQKLSFCTFFSIAQSTWQWPNLLLTIYELKKKTQTMMQQSKTCRNTTETVQKSYLPFFFFFFFYLDSHLFHLNFILPTYLWSWTHDICFQRCSALSLHLVKVAGTFDLCFISSSRNKFMSIF